MNLVCISKTTFRIRKRNLLRSIIVFIIFDYHRWGSGENDCRRYGWYRKQQLYYFLWTKRRGTGCYYSGNPSSKLVLILKFGWVSLGTYKLVAFSVQSSGSGCFSSVGHTTPDEDGEVRQILNLAKGCFKHGTIVHELLHTIGFYHMQSTYDRDEYVEIIWENIIAG